MWGDKSSNNWRFHSFWNDHPTSSVPQFCAITLMVPPRAIPDHVEWLLGSVSFRWKLSLSLSLSLLVHNWVLVLSFLLPSISLRFLHYSLLIFKGLKSCGEYGFWSYGFDLCEYRNFLLGFFVWFWLFLWWKECSCWWVLAWCCCEGCCSSIQKVLFFWKADREPRICPSEGLAAGSLRTTTQ